MRVIFIFKKTDNVMLIRALYEIAFWLIDHKEIEILFYIPVHIKINIFNDNKIDINWIDEEFTVSDIPEVDLVISSDLIILDELLKLSRGEIVFLNNDNSISKFTTLDLTEIGIGIPEQFFMLEKKKKKKIIIGGDQVERNELEKIFLGIEKAVPSFFVDEVVILSNRKAKIDTSINYSFYSEENIDYNQLFSEAFYLFWFDKGSEISPIIPIWAMASEVIVIALNSAKSKFEYPIKINKLEVMELALQIIKIYKMGQYRNKLLLLAKDTIRNNKMEIVGEKWYKYIKGILETNGSEEETKKYIASNDEKYIFDIIIDSNSLDNTRECIKKIKEYTDMKHKITIINKNKDNNIKILKKSDDTITIIDENSKIADINKAIVLGNGKYIILLKSGIEVSKGWLEPLIEQAELEDVAVVVPEILNQDGELYNNGTEEIKNTNKNNFFSNTGFTNDFYEEKEKLFKISRDCCLLKRGLLPIIGLLDEEYFLNFEDLDYMLRSIEKGYRVVYCPKSVVINKENGNKLKIKNTKNYNDSKKRFNRKWSVLFAGSEKRRETRKIIMTGLTSWNFKTQRLQNLAHNFVKLGYELIYINPICGHERYEQIEENIIVYTPYGSGTVLYNLKEGREFSIGKRIAEITNKLGFNNSVLMVNTPYWLPLLKYLEYSLLIYDCFENYSDFKNRNYKLDISNDNELQLLNIADLVLAGSNSLFQKIQKINENTCLLTNANNNIEDWFSLAEKLNNIIHLAYYGIFPSESGYIDFQDKKLLKNKNKDDIRGTNNTKLKIENIEEFNKNKDFTAKFEVKKKELSLFDRIKQIFNL